MDIIKMYHNDGFGNKTKIVRQLNEDATISDQIDVFLEYLKGIGYSVEIIKKIDEVLSDAV